MTPAAGAVLRALAAMSPSSDQHLSGDTIPLDWFRWLPASAVRMLAPGATSLTDPAHGPAMLRKVVRVPSDSTMRSVAIDHAFGERLAAVDQVRSGSLRVGWLFVAGRLRREGEPGRRVFHPLVTAPVRVQRLPFSTSLVPAGDAELTQVITDVASRHQLEAQIEYGGGGLDGLGDPTIPTALLARLNRLQTFAVAAAEAAGLPTTNVVPVGPGPEELLRSEGLQIVAGLAVYAVSESFSASRAAALRAWPSENLGRVRTAFHALYFPADGESSPAPTPTVVESPYLLTPSQQTCVMRSRTDPITVISGAPGTGKSQTVVATACDSLNRGESVLVVAKSTDAIDALIDLFQQAPSADPIVFGSHERRDTLSRRLADGQLHAIEGVRVASARRAFEEACARRDMLRSTICDALRADQLATDPRLADDARSVAPRLFEPGADLALVTAVVRSAAPAAGRGWMARRRSRRHLGQARQLAGATADTPVEELVRCLQLAAAARAGTGADEEGVDPTLAWRELLDATTSASRAMAEWLRADSRSTTRINASTLSSVAALATAVRSGRAARRAQLAHLDAKLVRALPLWIGSLPDVDDLLPAVPGLFDLVILDEASSIDQPLAASALLRARRAVIVGDSHQLRHVSFLSDDQMALAVSSEADIAADPALAARLDVRRNSVFDVGLSSATVTTLDEHFRSAPHLVEWVARTIYDGRLKIATRSPLTDSLKCIDVTHVEGHRDQAGVVRAEVDEVLSQLETCRYQGERSVGVITPFRPHADALEAAVLAAFSADDLERMNLRVGTVHRFQGNERDVIIASFAVGPDESANSWRFVEDPHLLNVLVTRARKSMRVVLSSQPPAGGLVDGYLKSADRPPGCPLPAATLDRWSRAVADHLEASGTHTAACYPTGRHIVDVCVSAGVGPTSVECRVHQDGPEAHIDRHLALRRAGWEILDAYESRWSERPGELAVELVRRLRPPTTPVYPASPR